MKNKSKLSIYSFLIMFAISFSLMILLHLILSLFVGLGGYFHFNDFILIFILSIISSLGIYIVLLFEKLNQVIQIDLIYIIFNIVIYTMCFVLKIYHNKLLFLFISLGISLLGLILITIVMNYFYNRENKSLNDSLLKYKERD